VTTSGTNSFAPLLSAEQDYQRFAEVLPIPKVVMYHNCGGPRLARHVENAHATQFNA